jgi:hypothetical protein
MKQERDAARGQTEHEHQSLIAAQCKEKAAIAELEARAAQGEETELQLMLARKVTATKNAAEENEAAAGADVVETLELTLRKEIATLHAAVAAADFARDRRGLATRALFSSTNVRPWQHVEPYSRSIFNST